MADTISREHRSWLMGRVGQKHTSPELAVRKAIHRMGYRFRLHRKDLPGRPDIVLPRIKKVIFVHGCFWHRHAECRKATTPKSNLEYWHNKFAANEDRDKKAVAELTRLGWAIRHVPTQRIVESYIYGQIHFDELDREDADPFTSSREGVVEDDERFQAFLDYVRRELMPKIIDDWDRLRLKHRKPGDEQNKRKTKKERRAADFVEAAEDEFRGADSDEEDVPPQDAVDEWLSELRPDAQFNVSAYVDCFLSENLLRKYIRLKNPKVVKGVKEEIETWRKNEEDNKTAANLNFALRQAEDDFDYLGMDALAVTAEGEGAKGKQQSLWKDAVSYKPVRNALGHTGVLTDVAKSHLSVTFENIKARIKNFMKDVPK